MTVALTTGQEGAGIGPLPQPESDFDKEKPRGRRARSWTPQGRAARPAWGTGWPPRSAKRARHTVFGCDNALDNIRRAWIVTNSLSIAAATREDLPDVARVHVASWRQTYVGLVPQSYLDSLDVAARLQKWRENFEQDRNNDLFGLFVARIGGSPAGFISFGPGRDEDRAAHAEIYAIYVLKQHWGNGIGYGLYKTARAIFQHKGLPKAYLWVLDTNRRAIVAYERWGGVLEQDRLKDHNIGGKPVKEISVIFNAM
jgi:RimJ/RimL family protein N-acetyltransferase